MIPVTEKMLAEARNLIAHGDPESVGYRIMIKPIDAVAEMEVKEKEMFPELDKAGFVDKTDEQAEKLSKGTFHGIVVHIGEFAYASDHLGGKPWFDLGDVLIFDRYAGVEMELPPGSGDKYRFVNDESVLGRMKGD